MVDPRAYKAIATHTRIFFCSPLQLIDKRKSGWCILNPSSSLHAHVIPSIHPADQNTNASYKLDEFQCVSPSLTSDLAQLCSVCTHSGCDTEVRPLLPLNRNVLAQSYSVRAPGTAVSSLRDPAGYSRRVTWHQTPSSPKRKTGQGWSSVGRVLVQPAQSHGSAA